MARVHARGVPTERGRTRAQGSVGRVSAAGRATHPIRRVRVWLVVLAVLATVLVVPQPSDPVA